MEHNETGYQSRLEAPKLCANNCGFFGSAATMNLCSKCHEDFVLKQECAQLASSSIGSITTESVGDNESSPVGPVALEPQPVVISSQSSAASALNTNSDVVMKECPKRCGTCKKRVGLMGFNCRCGNIFCAVHRYTDKHGCPFDYQTAAREAIAIANPVIKAEKLDKI